jgi:hypothetical protein
VLAAPVQIKPIDLKDALPIVGVAAGWALNEVSQLFRVRREDRKAVGRALADLLEIRHRLIMVPKAVEELSKRFPIPEQGQVFIGHALATLMPTEALTKRYEESVSLVAGVDPLLGFRLQSQDLVSPLISQMRAAALNSGSAAAWQKFERWFLEQLVPELDKTVLDVAWLHGIVTWFRTRRRLNRLFQIPAAAMDSLVATIQEAANQQRGEHEPNAPR